MLKTKIPIVDIVFHVPYIWDIPKQLSSQRTMAHFLSRIWRRRTASLRYSAGDACVGNWNILHSVARSTKKTDYMRCTHVMHTCDAHKVHTCDAHRVHTFNAYICLRKVILNYISLHYFSLMKYTAWNTIKLT